MNNSFPIYIIDNNGKDYIVVSDIDINHVEFWEKTVHKLVALLYKLPANKLKNLPYCQRRARIVDDIIYYGEQTSKELLKEIRLKCNNNKLKFKYEEHEKRLNYDKKLFEKLLRKFA